jgi:hypothetical protein
MRVIRTIAWMAGSLILVLATYLYAEAHRYDVVGVGAGSGGSQQDQGDYDITFYLVDHKTGKIWRLHTETAVPVKYLTCGSNLLDLPAETDSGCSKK